MANIILIKRGQIANIGSASLQEGELALAFDAEKKTVRLYAGNGTGTPIPVNGAEVSQVLADAKAYADQKISDLVGTAPEAYDTLQEIASYISTHENAYQSLLTVVGKKLEAPETAGTEGQVLKMGTDGKAVWADDTDTTYGEATQAKAGLMSAGDKAKVDNLDTNLGNKVDKVTGKGLSTNDYTTEEKTKLAGISSSTGDTQTASAAEKSAWNAKLDSTSKIDGGTF